MIRPAYALPYADTRDLDAAALAAKLARGEAVVFGHSLIDRYVPTFLATYAVKPG